MVDELFKQIISSSVLISIPAAIIYLFGTIINMRSVNRSKEDTCIYGLYFVMFFIFIPSLIYYYFLYKNVLNPYIINILKILFPQTISFKFHEYHIILLQGFITATLILISNNILQTCLSKIRSWLSTFIPNNIQTYLSKIRSRLSRSSSKNNCTQNQCVNSGGSSKSSLKNSCAQNRGMNYCLGFFICSSITIFSTLYFFSKNANQFIDLSSWESSWGYISLLLSFLILSLVACNLPSVHNEYYQARVFLSENNDFLPDNKDSLKDQFLFGKMLQNSDTTVKLYLEEKDKHIEINKDFIKYIETDGIPKREKLSECILSIPKNLIIYSTAFILFLVLLNLFHL